ncbi:hypothetical protein Syun_031604 [Stephania yunnanensis]|uniref:Uncharacterized protein n=1 Tax=Stephania yunnanensis TaxID=152371 RepID=A0AAP0DZW2_9MAGN
MMEEETIFGCRVRISMSGRDILKAIYNLLELLDALELSRLTMKTVKQNLWWAFAYNIALFKKQVERLELLQKAKHQRRRQELTQTTPDQPVDNEAVYYKVAGDYPKGCVYSLRSLWRKKRRYVDPDASTSQVLAQRGMSNFTILSTPKELLEGVQSMEQVLWLYFQELYLFYWIVNISERSMGFTHWDLSLFFVTNRRSYNELGHGSFRRLPLS